MLDRQDTVCYGARGLSRSAGALASLVDQLCQRRIATELCWKLGDGVIRRRSVLAC